MKDSNSFRKLFFFLSRHNVEFPKSRYFPNLLLGQGDTEQLILPKDHSGMVGPLPAAVKPVASNIVCGKEY